MRWSWVMVLAGVVGGLAGERMRAESVGVRVVELGSGGKGVEGVQVGVAVPNLPARLHGVTDQDGRVRVEGAVSEDGEVVVEALKAGWVGVSRFYVPEGVVGGGAVTQPATMPSEIVVEMERGETLSGRVVDGEGKAVEGAEVVIEPSKSYGKGTWAWADRVKTDAEGKWVAREVPTESAEMYVGVYWVMGLPGDFYDSQKAGSADEVRKWGARLVVERGVEVTGVVTEADGKAAAGAELVVGRWGPSGSGIRPIGVDGEGRYRVGILPGKQVTVTFRAPGCVPEMRTLTAGSGQVDVALAAAKPLVVKVVDGEGRRIRAARAEVTGWGKVQMFQELSEEMAEGAGTGRFVWKDSPGEVQVAAWAPGYVSAGATVEAGTEKVIALVKQPTIRGKVVDKATGKAVTDFRVEEGIVWEKGGPVVWQGGLDREIKKVGEGVFAYRPQNAFAGLAFRVIAPGYLPCAGEAFVVDGKDRELVFRLEAGKGVEGKVVDGAGKALEGVKVYVTGEHLLVENGRGRLGEAAATTDERGGFSFFPPEGRGYVVLVADEGGIGWVESGEMKEREALTVVREAWGRVEGEVLFERKPAPEGTVVEVVCAARERKMELLTVAAKARTDKAGHFEMERVLPGGQTIGREVKEGASMTAYADATPMQVVGGKTSHVRMGGEGRAVAGKVAMPAGLKGVRGEWLWTTLETDLDGPEDVMPAGVKAGGPAAQQAWRAAWLMTEAGVAWMVGKDAVKKYPVAVGADGTFRAENVGAGRYRFRGRYFEVGTGKLLGTGEGKVEVGEGEGEVVMEAGVGE